MTPGYSPGRVVILRGDAASLPLPDESVDLVVTSPPYFGLRSYTDDGEHYDGQIGSEATPREFLDALWRCTREWARVLKPEGSLFVNLGDSYASQPAGQPGANGQVNGKNPAQAHVARRGERNKRPTGGRQMTREDAAWLAGVIDSDGSVSVHVNKQPEGRAPSFVAWVRIGQMRPEVVRRTAEITGTGQIFQDDRGVWNWSASAQQARWVLARIYPWLLIKKRQAAAAIEVARHVEDRNGRGAYRPLTHDDIAYRQRLQDAVRAWNKGRDDDLVSPEPAPVPLPIYPLAPRAKSLYGLPDEYAAGCVGYLGLIRRADIIWQKPNGLPESVQDRVRRSHEVVFHFTKQPRYFSAVDEIREPHTMKPQRRPNGHKQRQQLGVLPAQTYSTSQRAEAGVDGHPLGKLPGSVWEIPSAPLTVPAHLGVDHFAAFPSEIPKRIILGWSPAGICTACGEGRRPVMSKQVAETQRTTENRSSMSRGSAALRGGGRKDLEVRARAHLTSVTGYACACTPYTDHPGSGEATRRRGYNPGPESYHAQGTYGRKQAGEYERVGPWREYHLDSWDAPPTRPAIVLDPFGGTGTTALVADVLGRTGITVDRSADYCRLAAWRTSDPAERARALGVPKPPPVMSGQGSLFDQDAS